MCIFVKVELCIGKLILEYLSSRSLCMGMACCHTSDCLPATTAASVRKKEALVMQCVLVYVSNPSISTGYCANFCLLFSYHQL